MSACCRPSASRSRSINSASLRGLDLRARSKRSSAAAAPTGRTAPEPSGSVLPILAELHVRTLKARRTASDLRSGQASLRDRGKESGARRILLSVADSERFVERARVAKRESKYVEFKQQLDPGDDGEWLEVTKDLVA